LALVHPEVRDGVGERPAWRAVAVPSEHGGWGLTLEPVLAGLLIAPSLAGVLIGVGALLTFLVRTPLNLVMVDVRRNRWLDRSNLALAIATVELVAIATITVIVLLAADARWLIPIAIAAPVIAVELWFEVRSRGRRLAPELCGAVAIGAAAPAIILVGGGDPRVAAGVWLILSARAVATIPFVRTQVARLRRRRVSLVHSDVVQLLAVVMAAAAIAIDDRMTAGCLAIGILAGVQLVAVRRAPIAARALGLRQLAFGIGIVVVTAAGAWL
jgi:hypothetical protein